MGNFWPGNNDLIINERTLHRIILSYMERANIEYKVRVHYDKVTISTGELKILEDEGFKACLAASLPTGVRITALKFETFGTDLRVSFTTDEEVVSAPPGSTD